MKVNVIGSFIALASCALSLGCMRAAPDSAEIAESPEGRPCGPDGVIEDGEDNNNQTNTAGGRGGYMYTFVDKAGSTIDPPSGESGGIFTPAAGGAEGSQYALRMKGTVGAAAVVFAGMGLNFVDPKGPYDASKYGGVSFWAKKGPGSTSKVRLKVPDISTDPDGKICSECFNDFGADLVLTEEWKKYTFPFDRLKQLQGWGAPRRNAIDKSKIYGVQFQVNDKGQAYDIWVDNVQFTGCGG